MSRQPAAAPSALVIGLGQRDRGDDAVGPEVAGRVRGLCLPGVRVIDLREPSALLDALAGADLVVVADAVRSGLRPGTVQILHACHDRLPTAKANGTHTFGLAEAVELARALGRMPPELIIVGVEVGGEAEHFRPGQALSPPVRAAVSTAALVIAQVIDVGRGG